MPASKTVGLQSLRVSRFRGIWTGSPVCRPPAGFRVTVQTPRKQDRKTISKSRSAGRISAREKPGPKNYGVTPSHNKGYLPRECSGNSSQYHLNADYAQDTPRTCTRLRGLWMPTTQPSSAFRVSLTPSMDNSAAETLPSPSVSRVSMRFSNATIALRPETFCRRRAQRSGDDMIRSIRDKSSSPLSDPLSSSKHTPVPLLPAADDLVRVAGLLLRVLDLVVGLLLRVLPRPVADGGIF